MWTRPRSIRARYLCALGLVGLVAIVQFAFLADRLSDQQRRADAIALASGQRTLAEQIANDSTQLVAAIDVDQRTEIRADLRAALATLDANERALTSERRIVAWNPPEVRRLQEGQPYDVVGQTREFVSRGTTLASEPPARLTRSNASLLYIDDMAASLMRSYTLVVDAYTADERRQADSLRTNEAFGAIALVTTLLLELTLIFLPMERELERNTTYLAREIENHARAQKTAHLGSWERDLRTGATLWSDELGRICGIAPDAAVDIEPGSFDHPDDAEGVRRAVKHARDLRETYSIDHRIVRADGAVRWIQEQGEFVYDDAGRAIRMLGTAFDIHERKRAEERLLHQAHHDLLTGLPNRSLFNDRLVRALSRARRYGTIVAVFFIDLDRFKAINDSLGHDVGDAFLRGVANRLRERVRSSDTVARLGGDEFAVVLSDLARVEDVAEIARDFVASCSLPYDVLGVELSSTASIGVALAPTDVDDAGALVRAADAAMYRAKEQGGATFSFYTAALHERARERLALENDLRHALERDEFRIHYQPIVGASGGTVAVEALLRWQHPERGMLGPDHFIALAEEMGTIVSIGTWVLEAACAQVRAWQTDGAPGLRLAVNISSRQFRERTFCGTLERILTKTSFAAAALELEITERVVMHDVEVAIATLRELKAMGVRLSVDDFGTGFSSLSHLQRFPIDTLKIDRSFIRDVPGNGAGLAVVETVMALARALRLSVVAEGVETHEQRAYLDMVHCNALQGYLFSEPLAPDAFARWIGANVASFAPRAIAAV